MRVVGARFGAAADAERALDDLRGRFDLGERDAAVRPLGSTAYEDPVDDAVLLAGRFWPDRVTTVSAVVTEHGGEVVLDEDEGRVR